MMPYVYVEIDEPVVVIDGRHVHLTWSEAEQLRDELVARIRPGMTDKPELLYADGVTVVKHPCVMSPDEQLRYRATGDQTAPGRQTGDLPPNSLVRALPPEGL